MNFRGVRTASRFGTGVPGLLCCLSLCLSGCLGTETGSGVDHAQVAAADAKVAEINAQSLQEASGAVRAANMVLASDLPEPAKIEVARRLHTVALDVLPVPTGAVSERWGDVGRKLIAGDDSALKAASSHVSELLAKLDKERIRADELARRLAADADLRRQEQADRAALHARLAKVLIGAGVVAFITGMVALYNGHLRLGVTSAIGGLLLVALSFGFPSVPVWAWTVAFAVLLVGMVGFGYWTYRVGLAQPQPTEGGAAQ